jgi:hypothetical protein
MNPIPLRIPRRPDQQLIECIKAIQDEVGLTGAKLYFHAFDGGPSEYVPLDAIEQNAFLKEVLPFNQPSLQTVSLQVTEQHVITIRRDGRNLFDSVEINWCEGRHGINQASFAKLIAATKKILNPIQIGEALKGAENDEINEYHEARVATLTKLDTIAADMLVNQSKHLAMLEEQFRARVEKLGAETTALRNRLQEEHDGKVESLRGREEAITKKESEFETRDSKYLRRQLRKDMLERLASLSTKFELTKGTRTLRAPITVFTILFMTFFATMTVWAFIQTGNIIAAGGQDLTKMNWWQIGFLVLKQLGFAGAFLGGAWFYIKWNDRWFRQHADAEFMLKQMELDINRASWVVEMALEWKEEQGRELPRELLDRLTRNLFMAQSQQADGAETPPDLASILLGSASNLKVKTQTGELELDRKGLKSALRQEGNGGG